MANAHASNSFSSLHAADKWRKARDDMYLKILNYGLELLKQHEENHASNKKIELC